MGGISEAGQQEADRIREYSKTHLSMALNGVEPTGLPTFKFSCPDETEHSITVCERKQPFFEGNAL